MSDIILHDLEFIGMPMSDIGRDEAEDVLRQNQKMEALGQLTGSIAHDFNNHLQVIYGASERISMLIDRETIDLERMRQSISLLNLAAEKGASLTAKMLAFARKQHLVEHTHNINRIIETMDEIISGTAAQGFEMICELDESVCNSRLDEVQVKSAILCLVANACDAMREMEGGKITIRTSEAIVQNDEAENPSSMPNGSYAVIEVIDNGCGMSSDIQGRAIEPFFSTKPDSYGCGLSLSMVYGFVKQSGGLLRIRSHEGIGTTISMFFPCIDSSSEVENIPTMACAETSLAGTILVVDDDTAVGVLALDFLELSGYKAFLASSGEEALDILNREPDIQMVFTDLIMPGGINGLVLAREARLRYGKLKILMTTGYDAGALESKHMHEMEFEVINKPYRGTELLRRIRSVMEAPIT